jgi:hypothetical protein
MVVFFPARGLDARAIWSAAAERSVDAALDRIAVANTSISE